MLWVARSFFSISGVAPFRFLKNCSGDSQFNSDKFSLVNPWLDFWEPASFSFLEWGEKFWVRELPLGEFFSWLLFILQSLVFSPGYLSMCTLSTCLLRFLVSFVKNACQQKIFKMSIKWVSDFYVLKIPGGWGTSFGQNYFRWLTSLNRVLSFVVFLCWKTYFGLDVVWEWL